MPIYCFFCKSPDHPEGKAKNFDQMIQHVPKKIINQYPCPECGGIARRDMSKEIPTQNIIGLTSISTSTTVKGSLLNTIKVAFGKFKRNPDGTLERNHAAFSDSGELDSYMNGNNDLGEPVLKDDGTPLRRQDGSVVRRGAKLFKYRANASPSRDGARKHRPAVPNAWTDEGTVNRANSSPSAWRPY